MKALILTDVQNDFVPGGALPVPGGNEIVFPANALQPRFDLVFATQDWHPAGHASFAANHPGMKPGDRIDLDGVEQILWPVHCVQHTHGAEFVRGLDLARVARIFKKGTDPRIDSYSVFFDNARRKDTGLGDYLKQKGVTRVYLLGLALDYCVKYSALDACRFGFDTFVIEDACRAIELQPGDAEKSIGEMKRAGVKVVQSRDL